MHEIKTLGAHTCEHVLEGIESLVEPVAAFDSTSDILGAAVTLACLDQLCPPVGRVALLVSWSKRQNVSQSAVDSVVSSLLARPEVCCDALEYTYVSTEYFPQRSVLETVLAENVDRPEIVKALGQYLPSWLGRWCRSEMPLPNSKAAGGARTSVEQNLSLLTADEMAVFRQLCPEVSSPQSAHTDSLAAVLLFAGPLEGRVESLWAWSLSQTVAGDYLSAREDIEWAIRLNPFDQPTIKCKVRELVGGVTLASSEPCRRAAALILRALGDAGSALIADDLSGPVPEGEKRRRVEFFCNTNPHDPDAQLCSNLPNAIATVTDVPVLSLRKGRFSTREDSDFRMALPALSRFAPAKVVSSIQVLARSVNDRDEMALRALCWDLPSDSPALDSSTIAILETALTRFVEKEETWSSDSQLIVNELLRTILPHRDAEQQISLLLRMPEQVTLYLTLLGTLEHPDTKQIETALRQALQSQRSDAVARVLFVASNEPIAFTPYQRKVVIAQLSSTSSTARAVAFDTIRQAGDPELDVYVLETAHKDGFRLGTRTDFYQTQTVVSAVIRSGQVANLVLVPFDLLQAAAALMGPDAVESVTRSLDATLEQLLTPTQTASTLEFPVDVEGTPDGLLQRVRLLSAMEDIGFAEFADLEAAAHRHEELQKQRQTAYTNLLRVAAERHSPTILGVPSRRCIAAIVQQSPTRVHTWLKRILAENEPGRLAQVHNFGAVLAGAYAAIDGALSAAVLRHIKDALPLCRISYESDHIPLYQCAVFGEADSADINSLRDELVAAASTDYDLELCARAASLCGASPWLLRFIQKHYLDDHPAFQARAMILAGFCTPAEDVRYVFAAERKSGFLKEVHLFALKQRTCALWAAHWCDRALKAADPVDFWRFGNLAEGVVDRRFVDMFENRSARGRQVAFEAELFERLEKAAKDRSEKRQKTLFGLRAPSDQVVVAMRRGLAQAAETTGVDHRDHRQLYSYPLRE